jgi:hypothetical protein
MVDAAAGAGRSAGGALLGAALHVVPRGFAAEATEGDLSFVLVGWRAARQSFVVGFGSSIDAGSVATIEATLNLSVLNAELSKNTDDIRADDLERAVGCCGHGEETFEENRLGLGRATRRFSIHLIANIGFVFFRNVGGTRAITTGTTSLHALSSSLIE